MKWLRVSISRLLAFVALASLTFAAIKVATPAWAGALYSLTFFALIASLLGIGFGRGARRVYWTGFAALGWGYMALNYLPLHNRYFGPLLLSPNLFDDLYDRIHIPEDLKNAKGMGMTGRAIFESAPAGSGMGMGGMGGGFRMMGGVGGGPPATPPVKLVDPQVFIRIGVALEALLWAFLGGWVARYFASGRGASGGAP